MRERIKAVIAEKPDLSVRNVSLAAGMSDSALNKFLNGSVDSITIRTAEKLAKALEVDARWLVFGEGDPEEARDIADAIEELSAANQELVRQLVAQLKRNGTTG